MLSEFRQIAIYQWKLYLEFWKLKIPAAHRANDDESARVAMRGYCTAIENQVRACSNN